MNAHRQLLFGLLALQNGFVDQNQLVAAFSIWTLDKSRLLDAILLEQNALDDSSRTLLAALVERHLSRHQQDPEQSLAALRPPPALRDRLTSIADPELGASLVRLPLPDLQKNEAAATQAMPTTPAGGRFMILRPHARGGLGQVSVALDSELGRNVALKEIREEYADDLYSQSRFVQEAEITGQLEHPGIVPVYGLGSYRNGRPYYAMRFIEGESLKAAVESFHEKRRARGPLSGERAVAFRNLLGRFVDACHAIQYAHSRKVIHRDLKPENIMLGPYGETLVVDWGLAKSLDSESTAPAGGAKQAAETLPTGNATRPVKLKGSSGATPTMEGAALGTPAYMSPEQADGRLAELGPTSDVYGLGATLYFLLTGQGAFGGEELSNILEAVRQNKFAPPRQIWHAAPRPLEAICLKAMSAKALDRYPSARALAEDIERWLADEPVSAFPDPPSLRARRWMKRHPALVASAAMAVLVGLASAVAVAGISKQHATELETKNDTITHQIHELSDRNSKIEEQNQALQSRNKTISEQKSDLEARNKAIELARKEELKAKERAEKVTEYLVKMFKSADPSEGGRDVRVVDLLDKQVGELLLHFEGDQVTRAALLDAIGQSYYGLGDYSKSVPLFQMALRLRREYLSPDALDTLYSMNQLGSALQSAGNLPEAIKVLEEAVERSTKEYGAEHYQTLGSQTNLADVYRMHGDLKKALDLNEQVLKIRQANWPEDERTFYAINNVALIYQSLSRAKDAVPLFEKSSKLLMDRFGKNYSGTLSCLGNLADAYRAVGDSEKAIETQRIVVAGRIETLGETHPTTLFAKNNLALNFKYAGKNDEAEKGFREVLPLLEAHFGKANANVLTTKINLANVHREQKNAQAATTLLQEAFDLALKDPAVLGSELEYAVRSYSELLSEQGDAAKSIEVYKAAVDAFTKSPATSPLLLLDVQGNLADALRDAGRPDEAVVLWEQVRRDRKKELGDDAPASLFAGNNLALCYVHLGRYGEAVALLDETVKGLQRVMGEDHQETLICSYNLAEALHEAGEFERAEATMARVLPAFEKKFGHDSSRFANALSKRGQILLNLKRYPEAESLFRKALVIRLQKQAVPFRVHIEQAHFGWAELGQGELNNPTKPLVAGVEGLLKELDALPPGHGPMMLRLTTQVIAYYEARKDAIEASKWRQKLDELKVRYSRIEHK